MKPREPAHLPIVGVPERPSSRSGSQGFGGPPTSLSGSGHSAWLSAALLGKTATPRGQGASAPLSGAHWGADRWPLAAGGRAVSRTARTPLRQATCCPGGEGPVGRALPRRPHAELSTKVLWESCPGPLRRPRLPPTPHAGERGRGGQGAPGGSPAPRLLRASLPGPPLPLRLGDTHSQGHLQAHLPSPHPRARLKRLQAGTWGSGCPCPHPGPPSTPLWGQGWGQRARALGTGWRRGRERRGQWVAGSTGGTLGPPPRGGPVGGGGEGGWGPGGRAGQSVSLPV